MSRQRNLQVGTTALVAFAIGVVGVFAGTLSIQNAGQIEFRGPDIALTVTGVELFHLQREACTGSGGFPNYDFCTVDIPDVFSGSGVLLDTDLECGDLIGEGFYDVSFTKNRTGSTTSSGSLILANDQPLTGTGHFGRAFTGAIAWNSADILRISTIERFAASEQDCVLIVKSRDKYGD